MTEFEGGRVNLRMVKTKWRVAKEFLSGKGEIVSGEGEIEC